MIGITAEVNILTEKYNGWEQLKKLKTYLISKSSTPALRQRRNNSHSKCAAACSTIVFAAARAAGSFSVVLRMRTRYASVRTWAENSERRAFSVACILYELVGGQVVFPRLAGLHQHPGSHCTETDIAIYISYISYIR